MARTAKTAAPQPEVDFLSTLGTVSSGPKPKNSSGKVVDTLTIAELASYAALDYIEKQIKSLKDGLVGAPIREQVYEYIVPAGIELGYCPENPKGIDGNNVVDASLQLRKKNSTSNLSPDVQMAFAEIDVPLDVIVIAPHTLRVKPEVFKNNKAMLNKMMQCLVAGGFNIDDILETQLPTEKVCVADTTVDRLFAVAKNYAQTRPNSNTLNPDRVRELLEMVTERPSARCNYHGQLSDALAVLQAELIAAPPAPAKEKRKK